jgi:hypothetical protein
MSWGQLVVIDQSSERRSPMKAGGGTVQTETGAVRCLSIAVGGRGVEGKEVGEEARCTGACERKTTKRGTTSGDAFLWRFGGEEKGRGSGLVPCGGRIGAER